ncbi:hypothetical protein JOF42_000361 [Microbacterium phyllosphaerae]|uniref:Uncharacterized protein n=1 Tax=Microbacterium phyllosphaerae TaxID=124798 RepID=A0ABS4WKY5_9MICO|nr:hypothetical protein [Microbacterium phyllosphaerae]
MSGKKNKRDRDTNARAWVVVAIRIATLAVRVVEFLTALHGG